MGRKSRGYQYSWGQGRQSMSVCWQPSPSPTHQQKSSSKNSVAIEAEMSKIDNFIKNPPKEGLSWMFLLSVRCNWKTQIYRAIQSQPIRVNLSIIIPIAIQLTRNSKFLALRKFFTLWKNTRRKGRGVLPYISNYKHRFISAVFTWYRPHREGISKFEIWSYLSKLRLDVTPTTTLLLPRSMM